MPCCKAYKNMLAKLNGLWKYKERETGMKTSDEEKKTMVTSNKSSSTTGNLLFWFKETVSEKKNLQITLEINKMLFNHNMYHSPKKNNNNNLTEKRH